MLIFENIFVDFDGLFDEKVTIHIDLINILIVLVLDESFNRINFRGFVL